MRWVMCESGRDFVRGWLSSGSVFELGVGKKRPDGAHCF